MYYTQVELRQIQQLTYMQKASELKANLMPHVGKDCMLIVGDYMSGPFPHPHAGDWTMCTVDGCHVKHRRRLSALCNVHADLCVICAKYYTGNPKKFVCGVCWPKREDWSWVERVVKERGGVHNLHFDWHCPINWFSDWAKCRGIRWGHQFMLASTYENQQYLLKDLYRSYSWRKDWMDGINSWGYGLRAEKLVGSGAGPR
jgi:hypothetical protein